MLFHWRPKGLVIYSSHKVLKRIIRTFIVLAGLQNQCNRVTDCLLMHDALPSYRNGVLPLNQQIHFSRRCQDFPVFFGINYSGCQSNQAPIIIEAAV